MHQYKPDFIQEENLAAMPPLLLGWYDQYARVLPWRQEPTPYRVWVSEMMLQQTRVEAAINYFQRFMKVLPDVAALAEAEEETLLKLWEGLGYYSRARNLQKAAKLLMEQSGGQLPSDPIKLKKLPGIGEYSAGAIASIAFNLPVPAVDGNVLRVLSRLTASREDIGKPDTRKAFSALLTGVIPPRAGDFNQALMDLGATVCLPNGEPKCGSCPLAGLCRAARLGIARELPKKAPKKPRRVEHKTVMVVICGQLVLLHQRPSRGLLSGLWEFLTLEGERTRQQTADLFAGWGTAVAELSPLPAAKHIFTHLEWRMTGYRVAVDFFPAPEGCQWVRIDDLAVGFPLSSAYKSFRQALVNN